MIKVESPIRRIDTLKAVLEEVRRSSEYERLYLSHKSYFDIIREALQFQLDSLLANADPPTIKHEITAAKVHAQSVIDAHQRLSVMLTTLAEGLDDIYCPCAETKRIIQDHLASIVDDHSFDIEKAIIR